jgi:CRP-like cAMP-binding protein
MGNMPSDCRAAVAAYAHLQILSRALRCDGPAWTSPQARGALVSLAESLSVRWVAAGRDVVRAGDPSTTLYIVFHGTVARRTASDGPHGVAHGPGASFGHMAATRTSAFVVPATVQAITATEVLILSRDAYTRFAAEHPALAATIEIPDVSSYIIAPASLAAGAAHPELLSANGFLPVARSDSAEELRTLA